jgi:hypothetical protein
VRPLGIFLAVLLTVARAASAQIQITNGVPIGGLFGGGGSQQYFVLAVPGDADSITIATVCNDPDADIYLRWGSLPSVNAWNYKSDGPSSNESITIENPPGGNLYIMLHGHSSFSSLGIYAEFFGSNDIDVIELDDGDVINGLFGFEDDVNYFKIDVPIDQDEVKIKLTGTDPDADLYVRWDDLPWFDEYDAKAASSGSNETITITNPPSGSLYIMVYAYSTYFNAKLSASYEGAPAVIELENAQATPKFGGYQGSQKLFAIELPDDADWVTFSMYGGSGDADMYIRWDAPPTANNWDYRPYEEGNNESVSVDFPDGGVVYILVNGYESYANVRLKVTYAAWKHYSHNHGSWKNDKIGTSSIKIKNGGAMLGALSMALSYVGADVDPGTLNAWLKSHDGYKNGSTIKWRAPGDYDGSKGLEYVGTGSVTSLAAMRELLDEGSILIARSDRYDTNDHWVVIRYYTGNGNSWSKFHYWDPADASPGVDRTLGDGWVGSGSALRIYEVLE